MLLPKDPGSSNSICLGCSLLACESITRELQGLTTGLANTELSEKNKNSEEGYSRGNACPCFQQLANTDFLTFYNSFAWSEVLNLLESPQTLLFYIEGYSTLSFTLVCPLE